LAAYREAEIAAGEIRHQSIHRAWTYCNMDAVNPSAAPKFGTIGVATSKKMAIVGARINEKLAHLGADLRHSLFCALHPSVLRLAAKESNIAIKSVATGMLKLSFNLNS
jgi:hypothetical protein